MRKYLGQNEAFKNSRRFKTDKKNAIQKMREDKEKQGKQGVL